MPAAPVVPEDLRTRLARVRAFVLDVDGVLTDGSMTFDEDGREVKTFDVKDGFGLVLMRDLGYRIGVVSSRVSKVVTFRCRELKIPEGCVLQGERDKLAAFERLVALWDIDARDVVAVGDDLPDLGMLRRAGVGACPSDAIPLVRDASALTLTKPGGAGAVRELCDLILEIRRGARADRPMAVVASEPPSEGGVIPFPTR
ncbi:MAG TPA: HAD hydrolase family protein [Thermoanaerobaculia bacterium]|nr:HAD hydrolase family protein [Thermoanaerobaculia bacterium]